MGKIRLTTLLAFLIVLAAGASGGWFVRSLYSADIPSVSECGLDSLREYDYDEREYPLINPLLLCEVSGRQEFSEFSSLKNKILKLISEKERQGKVKKVSLYFRDYNQGKWLNIHEEEKYAPASLLKVPILIAHLKLAELKPEVLQKKILYDGSFDFSIFQNFAPKENLSAGESYTIEDLLKRMIMHSDNNAAELLIRNIDKPSLFEVYSDLGLSAPPENSSEAVDFITVKDYAYFFRLLYNGTYLSRTMSQKALDMLTFADFPNGISAGIPQDISVAQKFGERSINGAEPVRELHDCGIVYYPHHPYLLCIMTKGENFESLSQVLQEISKFVFKQVTQRL